MGNPTSSRALPRGVFRNPASGGLRYGIQFFRNGKRHRVLVSDSLAEAVRIRKDMKAAARVEKLGIPLPSGNGTQVGNSIPDPRADQVSVAEYASRFLSQYESGSPKTHAKYRSVLNVFRTFLEDRNKGDIFLHEINTALTNDYITWRGKMPLARTQPFRRTK